MNPRLWNLATAPFFSTSITIGSYQGCQLPYRVTQSVTTLPICAELSPELSCYPLYTEASQFNLLLSFLPDLYIHYLPTFPLCQIRSSLSDSLVPGSAVPWGYATLGCLQRSGPFPAVLFPRLTISRASLNKLCLKYITLFLAWEKQNNLGSSKTTTTFWFKWRSGERWSLCWVA